jgi:hypothetical protein
MPGPSLVDTIGRWFDDGTTQFKSNLQGAQQSFDQFADQTRDAAKDATDAVIGLPERTHCVGARALCAGGNRPGLQRGSDRGVPKQGVYDRQEPRHPVGAEMPGAGLAPRPRAQRWRMSDRDIRDACALPIARTGH